METRWIARLSPPFQQDRFDRIVIRVEPAFDAVRSGCLVEMQVAGDHRPVAYLRDEVRGVEMRLQSITRREVWQSIAGASKISIAPR